MYILELTVGTHTVWFSLIDHEKQESLEQAELRHSFVKTLVARLRAGKRASCATTIELDVIGLTTIVEYDAKGKPVERQILFHIGNSTIDLEIDEAEALADMLEDPQKKVRGKFRMSVQLERQTTEPPDI